MINEKYITKLSTKGILIIILFLISGAVYIISIRNDTKKQQIEMALQIARSVEASLPREELDSLPDTPEKLQTQNFDRLKRALQQVIAVNKNVGYAYLYLECNNRLYFIVDSEPDKSSTGQEFTEADAIDKKPFRTGLSQVTKPVTYRRGAWVRAEVPVKDFETGQIIAVFGMDYNAKSWNSQILFKVLESVVLVIFILFLVFLAIQLIRKNFRLIVLQNITESLKTEKTQRENERQLSKLIKNLPGMVYRCAFDADYSMEFISDACLRITGYSPEKFVNKKNIVFNDLILPEYREIVRRKWHQSTSKKRIFEDEYQIKTASGDIKWLWERGSGVFNENGELQYLEGYIEDITDIKLSEEKLKQSEANFNRSIEESPFGIRIISDDRKTLYANPTLLNIFGFESLDDFNQIPATDWYSYQSHSEHLIREDKRIKGLPVESEYEISIVRPNSEIRNLQVFRSEILWNGKLKSQIIYLDISKRKRAENELRKLSQAIEQNPVPVFITNAEGIINYINPKFTEVTGYSSADALGENPRILKSGITSNQIYTDLWETITSGKIWKGELINKKKNGELFWVNKSVSPILDSQGQITNFVSIAEDITQKKINQAELIKAKEKAEEGDRLKSAFLANISHEVRTPMNGILGFAELLKTPDLSTDEQHEFIDVIEKSSLRMLNIINDLMDMSKIEAGETILRIRKTDVNKMLHEIHLFFIPEVNQKNIHFDYHCPISEKETDLETDSTKLKQILTNLIRNALKFTSEGAITFGYIQKDSTVEFYVSDTGSGIEPEQKDLIFERFMQGSLGHTRKHEGAGLGLAISKAYIELLGGSIWLESELNKGSTFRFELPNLPNSLLNGMNN